MKKISDVLKYEINEENDVILYAFHKKQETWINVASCHLSCLEFIKKAGSLKMAIEQDIPIVFNKELFKFND